MHDPCEKEPTDATANLTDQEREDITAYAQVRHRIDALPDSENVKLNIVMIVIVTKKSTGLFS